MTDGKFISKEARLQLDPKMRDVRSDFMLLKFRKDINRMVAWQVEIRVMPLKSACECGKEIVEGDNNLTVPRWYRWTKLWKVLCPGIMDRWIGFLLMPCNSHNEVPIKKLTHFVNGLTQFLSF
ncbi:hypothetical protein Golob_016222 [Gossypium lobatum]|uniref:Uncharacterized protein n=1 Tax=Gossypium lobatum TaxID=34289 RepID=A0A7J8M3I1_9ROSI|nr:hypothetical protein [Gossypium lobatum]